MTGDESIYELIAFLTSSAEGLLIEPKIYGPLRCLDAASRLIDLMLELGLIGRDDYLVKLKEEIDRSKFLVLYDEEKFRESIIKINVELARRVKELLGIK